VGDTVLNVGIYYVEPRLSLRGKRIEEKLANGFIDHIKDFGKERGGKGGKSISKVIKTT